MVLGWHLREGVSQKYAHAHNVGGRGPVLDRTHTTTG